LIGWLVGWLVDWLVGWLVSQSANQMVSQCSISFLLEIADDEVSRHYHYHVLEMVILNMTLTTCTHC
jgi:hypothetical protein